MIIPDIIPDLYDRDDVARSTTSTLSRAVQEISAGAAKSAPRFTSHLMARYLPPVASRADDDEKTEEECHPQPNVNLCEKGATASRIDIIVPVCIAAALLIILFSTLLYLHLRRKKRDEAEWSSKNNHEMEDYGLEPPLVGKPANAHSRR